MSSPSAAAAAEAAALFRSVKQALATSFIGFAIATTLYGITLLQTYLYFRSYRKDHWFLKSTVALLCVLDTLTTIFVAHSLYTSFILDMGKSLELQLVIPWSFNAEKLLTTFITFIAQCFYARILWRVGKSIKIASTISVLAVAAFGMGIYTSVHLFKDPLITSISDHAFNISTVSVQAIASLVDILITVAMCYYLHNKRSGFRKNSEDLIDSLMLYAVSRGILTATCQIMFMILNVSLPHDTYWQPFHQALAKLYVNSVLATLNVRHSLNTQSLSDVGFDSKGEELKAPKSTNGLYVDVEENASNTVTSRIQFQPHPNQSQTSTYLSSVSSRDDQGV